MRKFFTALMVLAVMGITSCTENQRAKQFGGTMNVSLQPHEQFVNMTFKEDDLWVIVYDERENKFKAKEFSSFGILQGEVIVNNPTGIDTMSWETIKN